MAWLFREWLILAHARKNKNSIRQIKLRNEKKNVLVYACTEIKSSENFMV